MSAPTHPTPASSDAEPAASAHPDTAAALRDDLASASATLEALEAEYAELLADPGVSQEDRDATRTVLEAAREQAINAQEAIARIADGSYGTCANCGKAIAPERLEALPDADLCVSCA